MISSIKNARNDYKDHEYSENIGHNDSSDNKMRLHSAFLSNYNSRYCIISARESILTTFIIPYLSEHAHLFADLNILFVFSFLSDQLRLILPEKSLKRAEARRPLMGPDGRYLYPCGYCQKTFCSLSDLNRHIGFHESKGTRPFFH